MALLEANDLVKRFRARRRRIHKQSAAPEVLAVDHVSISLEAGETLAVVGESGAGKSTLGRLVLRLIEPDEGTIVFDGRDVRTLGTEDLRTQRRQMQMVFQDPYSCFDPRVEIGISVAEPLRVQFGIGRRERTERAVEALRAVRLGPHFLHRRPHELSGGQLQRAAIARALTLQPKLIVCDEPVAALDVSVRAQVLNVLSDLQEQFGISYLFISHDLALVEVIADRTAVMRYGKIVEMGVTADVFRSPRDPYTQELLDAIPVVAVPGTRASA